MSIAELPIPPTPSPHQLLTKLLRSLDSKNIEEIFVITVDQEGIIEASHSGLSLERALYYTTIAQQNIIDEARGLI